MGRRPGLTLDQRNVAIGMLTGGMMVKDVAQHFRGSESAISRFRLSTVKQAPSKIDHVLADRAKQRGVKTITL